MVYQRRALDDELDLLLGALPAVAIDGAKAVGKTSTFERRAKSVIALDSRQVREAAAADPESILIRRRPVLIDEWQKVPETWDVVRRAVDRDRTPGQFLLTGSATPRRDATAHSGAGRITRLRMRPLAFSERGITTPTVSLERLLAGTAGTVEGHTNLRLTDYIAEIMASGFPGLRGLPNRLLRGELDSYLRNAVDRDIPDQGLAVRKPAVLLDWLRAYAAATAGTASYTEILDAATAGVSDKPARSTTVAYRDALQQLWLLDPLPAWAPIGQEFVRLGQTPTHHLADPALAARLLGLTHQALLDGAGTPLGPQHGTVLGRLFESLVTLSVRVLAQRAEATVTHLRTRNGDHEIDLMLTNPEGKVLAAEVKLSGTVSDHDLRQLKWLTSNYTEHVIDRIAITTGPFAYRRPDGIAIVPLSLLGP
ncbi:MAG: ATP-binding protein [Acidimicrobiales bacterium]